MAGRTPGTGPVIPLPFPGNDVVHGLFVGLGVCAAVAVFVWEKRRRGLSDDRLWVVVAFALLLGAVGSRLGTWLGHPDIPLIEWWLTGNRSILPGLLGAWIGVHLGKRLTGYQSSTGDLFAPAVALGMAIGRIGCGLTELPGTPTGGAWGMTIDDDFAAVVGAPAGVALHPSLFYEVVFHAVAFAVLWRFRDRLGRPGDLFVSYVAAYAVFRFAVEFVRGNAPFMGGLSGPQTFALVLMPILVWRLVGVVQRARSPIPREVAA